MKEPIFSFNFITLWKKECKRWEYDKKYFDDMNKKHGKDFKMLDKNNYFGFLPENERKSILKIL